jgi:hypothetical protein
MQREQVAIQLPIIHVGGGVHIIVGGFIEIDDSNPESVVLTYVGGKTRELDKEQSDSFLTQLGLRESRAVQPFQRS